jgi:hypothetical protein
MLLPASRQVVTDTSLANHLSLVACRKRQGNAHLVNELIRLVYLTFYLQEAGFGNADMGLYVRAEVGVEEAGLRGVREGAWYVTDDLAMVLEEVLATHDRQLETAPLWQVIDARERLIRFVQGDRRSPIPGSERTKPI